MKINKELNEKTLKLIDEKSKELGLARFASRLLKDSLKREVFDVQDLLNVLSTKNKTDFEKFNIVDITYIFHGLSICNDSIFYYEYKNSDRTQSLYDITAYYDEKTDKTVKEILYEAQFPDWINFSENLLKLIYLTGGKLKKTKSNEYKKGYYFFIKTKDNKKFKIACNTNILSYFSFIYFYYHRNVFDKNIMPKNNKYKAKLSKLINKSDKSKNLCYHLMSIFNDFDFIYSIMAHLKTEKELDIFLLMLAKNEGISGHTEMNTISNCVSEAFYLYNKPHKNYKPVFIRDIVKEYMKDETSKKLYIMLNKIIKHREKTENILIFLKTQKNKEKMIKFLEKGETDINKIHNKMIQLVVRKRIKNSNNL